MGPPEAAAPLPSDILHASIGMVLWFICIGIVPIWAIVHRVAYALIVYGVVVRGDD